MSISALSLLLLVFTVAAACTGLLVPLTERLRSLDEPNERSSHTVPTPRGGGVAVVITASLGVALASMMEAIETDLALALIGGGLAVAIVGFIDDHRGVSTMVRLGVHTGAALWGLFVLDGIPYLQVGPGSIELTGFWVVVSVLGIIWTLNLFNFMDGIDGIAASEATFVSSAGALLAISMGVSSGVSIAAAILAGSSLGFLFWNWPPAKIFMGDIGSGYLGYMIAILALVSAMDSPIAVWVWLALGGGFFIDATLTLARRLVRRERVSQGHREHAYQNLARRWNSHSAVTIGLTAINVLWLLPAAVWCILQPERAVYIIIGSYLPLFVVSFLAGAGRSERAGPTALVEKISVDG